MTIKKITVTSVKDLKSTLTNMKSETAPIYILFNEKAEKNQPEPTAVQKLINLMNYGTNDGKHSNQNSNNAFIGILVLNFDLSVPQSINVQSNFHKLYLTHIHSLIILRRL